MPKPTMKYRARGHWLPTGRDSWITTVWRATEKEAQQDIAGFAETTKRYSKTWIVKKKKYSLKRSW